MDSAYGRSTYGGSTYGNPRLVKYLEHKALAAEPLELVVMLYGKALAEIREARRCLAEGNIQLRSNAIAKACDVIGELDGSLNLEAGGDLAKRLRALYGYCLVRLLDANLHQADAPLAEVLGLLSTLADGWQGAASGDASYADSVMANSALASPALASPSHEQWAGPMEVGQGPVSDQSHSWTL